MVETAYLADTSCACIDPFVCRTPETETVAPFAIAVHGNPEKRVLASVVTVVDAIVKVVDGQVPDSPATGPLTDARVDEMSSTAMSVAVIVDPSCVP